MFPAPGQFYMQYPSAGHLMAPHAHPYGNLVTNGNENYSPQPARTHPHGHSQSFGSLAQNLPPTIETVHLYVPNTMIGAIIGTKGLFIKSIIKNSSASVKVWSLSPFTSSPLLLLDKSNRFTWRSEQDNRSSSDHIRNSWSSMEESILYLW